MVRDVDLVDARPEEERADVIVVEDVEVAGAQRARAAAAAAARRRSAAIDGEALAGTPEVSLPAAPRDRAPVVRQDAVVVLEEAREERRHLGAVEAPAQAGDVVRAGREHDGPDAIVVENVKGRARRARLVARARAGHGN